jgi:hypothetical protein
LPNKAQQESVSHAASRSSGAFWNVQGIIAPRCVLFCTATLDAGVF